MNMSEHLENRLRFPAEELEKYAGRYVAWSPDGARIIASAERLSELASAIRATDFDPRDCVLSSVPDLDELVLGEALGR